MGLDQPTQRGTRCPGRPQPERTINHHRTRPSRCLAVRLRGLQHQLVTSRGNQQFRTPTRLARRMRRKRNLGRWTLIPDPVRHDLTDLLSSYLMHVSSDPSFVLRYFHLVFDHSSSSCKATSLPSSWFYSPLRLYFQCACGLGSVRYGTNETNERFFQSTSCCLAA